MGLEILPDELQISLAAQWPCRELQIRQLSAFVHRTRPSPSTLVLYGPRATGKSGLLKAYLDASGLTHAIVRCRECVTGRHLLERTVSLVRDGLAADEHGESRKFSDGDFNARCENLSTLVVRLQDLLVGKKKDDGETRERFVLVFDGVDVLREPPPTLLPALGRLGEYIPGLTTILVARHPPPRFLHQSGIPYIHFPPYTREQSIHILAQNPPDIFLSTPDDNPDYDEEVHNEDKAWLWPRFCAAVWDAIAQNAARDLVAFRDVCMKLWRPFLAPVIKGDFGTRDFSRLIVAQRRLFQDESVLLDSIVAKLQPPRTQQGGEPATSAVVSAKSRTNDFPYYAKWLLVAAYLASFNPARLDATFFMKTSERNKRKRKGGGGRPSQKAKTPRHLLAASAFSVDRLLSILHAILPHDLRTTIDVYTQIATLASLRLLVRSGGLGGGDPLEPGGKWRVGTLVTWEFAMGLARGLDFELSEYLAE